MAKISESAKKIRAMIEKAVETHKITREEYDKILNLATHDAFLDPHEKALLHELNDMIADRTIKFVKDKK
jgi:hypothetical protein